MQEYATSTPQPAAGNLLESPAIQRAFSFIDQCAETFEAELVRVCEIAAPPFKERARALYVKRQFEEIGFPRITMDEEGNVVAERPGRGSHPSLAVSAHLDTVFPEGTDVQVRREGRRLLAPGIGDNACGIVSLLALARALSFGQVETVGTIYLVGTVGEEGEGNLRGVRFLFSEGALRSGVDNFISLDGPGLERITNRALGSRRYRVKIEGPGGHSWGDFGIVNPVHALGRAIGRFASYPAPMAPRTSYNVGVVEGGSSVNAIAESATMTVDIRSVSDEEIDKLESFLRRVVEIAVREENSQRALSSTSITYEIDLVGNRPSGETPPNSEILRAALDCSRALGIEPHLDCSSTDSNIPISLGIPALTLGVGGASSNCHSLAEWYEPTGREAGLKRLVLLSARLARPAV
jgi:acetylornithine deacetylase/succinyl-diaminopimelate desuccinylase-like protein